MISKIIKEYKHKDKIKASAVCLALFLGIILFGLPLSVGAAYFLVFNHKIYPRISVCEISLTGQNKETATRTIKLKQENFPEKITLSWEKEKFNIDVSSLKLTYDNELLINCLFALGREKFPLLNLKKLYSLYTKGQNLSYGFSVDDKKIDEEISAISAKFSQPVVNPEIKILKKGATRAITVEPGKNGREIDKRVLKTAILQKLACPQKETEILLPLNQNSPEISPEMAEKTKTRANDLLEKEIVLKLDERRWKINDEEIISFLSFENGFDRNKVDDYGRTFAKTINSQPENATFQFENNFVKVFNPSKEGITLKEAEWTEKLLIGLIELEKSRQNQEIEIPVIRTPAQISTNDANSLGIKELIGKGTSLFYGSIAERIHNLKLAGLKLNGILIPPGETFSFNKSLGDVSSETGFKQAYIIKDGRTVLGDGGGVCQVSTTLFRAALNAGLPIVERQAHAYRVHYYEDDLGPGFDSTVFDPNADLKIKNDTSSHILIQSSIDLKKKQMTFELYGAKDGRMVEISKARVWDKIPPPPDVYQDDPTLPIGTIKQVDWKAWGSKTAFDYKVTRNGEVLIEKTFNSTYKPWQAVFLRGTGK